MNSKTVSSAKSLICIQNIIFRFFVIFVLLFSLTLTPWLAADTSTPEDRAALFDYILAKTLEREAFSPIKNQKLNLDVKKEMLRYRDELIAADTDEKLFYTLVKISNARKDRHLKVGFVKGGLVLTHTDGVELDNYSVLSASILHAPIRFETDFGTPGQYFVFVSDYPKNIADFVGKIKPEVGDKLLAVNGQAIDEYRKKVEPYHRYSTIEGFWMKFPFWIPQKSYQFPLSFFRENSTFLLEKLDGKPCEITLPYLPPDTINWAGFGEKQYPGFKLVYSTQTYNLYRPIDRKPVILLDWHGFKDTLIVDMDRLMEYAVQNKLLDHDIIFDGTHSGGGSRGAYVLSLLSPKPFKTTFGNLRLSDIIPAFIKKMRKRYKQKKIANGEVREGIEEDSSLMDWLENDVILGVEAGQAYSNNVPFKLAHLPKWSDGIMKPAKVHFRGRLVCWFSPYGGSHLDQFNAMVADNKIGYTMGMPTHGYSNTWEWKETLIFPVSKKPVIWYMWNIGHTIRPNGEILEGNPAHVDEYIPLTRDNHLSYYEILLSRTFKHLDLE